MVRKFGLDNKSDITKKLFANTIMDLAQNRPISKINVKDICDSCGMKRQSFYYHFKDKYDLVAWIFMQDFYYGLDHSDILNSEEMICIVTKKLDENRRFYKNALSDYNQNNLGEYMLNLYIKMELDALEKYIGKDNISFELEYAVRSYSYASLEHTRKWLAREENISVERFARLMYSNMPQILKEAFRV